VFKSLPKAEQKFFPDRWVWSGLKLSGWLCFEWAVDQEETDIETALANCYSKLTDS
jgi:hypothetical protein